jgi:hypothetical protein
MVLQTLNMFLSLKNIKRKLRKSVTIRPCHVWYILYAEVITSEKDDNKAVCGTTHSVKKHAIIKSSHQTGVSILKIKNTIMGINTGKTFKKIKVINFGILNLKKTLSNNGIFSLVFIFVITGDNNR